MIKKIFILFLVTVSSIGVTFQNEVFAGGLSSDLDANVLHTPIPLNQTSNNTVMIEGESVQGAQAPTGNTFVTGTVRSLNNNILSLDTDEGVREFILPENAYAMRGTLGISTNNLTQGEAVTLHFDQNGNFQSLESHAASFSSSTLFNNIRELLTIGLFSILIAGSITTIMSSRNDQETLSYPQPRVIGI